VKYVVISWRDFRLEPTQRPSQPSIAAHEKALAKPQKLPACARGNTPFEGGEPTTDCSES
jgi:hypothetical protein